MSSRTSYVRLGKSVITIVDYNILSFVFEVRGIWISQYLTMYSIMCQLQLQYKENNKSFAWEEKKIMIDFVFLANFPLVEHVQIATFIFSWSTSTAIKQRHLCNLFPSSLSETKPPPPVHGFWMNEWMTPENALLYHSYMERKQITFP